MIMLERKEPSTIAVLEAILRRLPKEDVNYGYYEDKLARERSGYYGELRVDREWEDFTLGIPYILLNGLHLENDAGFSHQIDSFFLCPYFVFVIEAKNIAGRIEIDEETNQCIRTRNDGIVEGFTNPVDQVRRHGRFVKGMLQKFDMRLPIECAVIFANSNSVIGKINARDVLVFQVTGLRYKLDNLLRKHRQPLIVEDQIYQLGKDLKSLQTVRKWEPKINRAKLRKGVLCKACMYRMPMQYKHGKWVCFRCGNIDNLAFLEALNDYRLLWNEWISNCEFREFMGISSKDTASRILRSLGIESVGTYKDRKYLIPEKIKVRVFTNKPRVFS
ncbi:NERD domain-containing protein [Lysinibacillus sp. BW-2-10]|nr:NERD domain-containing protein [Lysinibacillus sp. BW-2-10]